MLAVPHRRVQRARGPGGRRGERHRCPEGLSDASGYPDDFWTPAMAAEVNMDAALLEQAVDWVATSHPKSIPF